MNVAAEIMQSEKLDDFDYKVALQQQMVAAEASRMNGAAVQNVSNGVLRPLQIGPPVVAAPSLSSPETTDAVVVPVSTVPTTEMLTIGPIAPPTRPDPSTSSNSDAPRRLHVSNIPFKYRDPDLVAMFEKMGPVTEVEIIFNERGSKGFGFVTMQRPEDAERARAELNGITIEGRRVEVNLATQRIHNKKPAKPLMNVGIDPMATQNALAAQQIQRAALLQQQQQLLAQQMLIPRQQFLMPPTSAALNMQQALQLQLLANQQLQGQHLLLNAAALPQQPPTSMAQQILQQQQQQSLASLGLDPLAQAQQMAALIALEQQRLQMAAVAQGRIAPGATRIPTSTTGGAIPPPPPAGPPPGSLGDQYLQQTLPGAVPGLHHHNLHPAAAAAALQRRFAPY